MFARFFGKSPAEPADSSGRDWEAEWQQGFLDPVKAVLQGAGRGELGSHSKVYDALGLVWAKFYLHLEQHGWVSAEGSTLEADLKVGVLGSFHLLYNECGPKIKGKALNRDWPKIEKEFRKHLGFLGTLPTEERSEGASSRGAPPGLATPQKKPEAFVIGTPMQSLWLHDCTVA